jgi:hypothetical protein
VVDEQALEKDEDDDKHAQHFVSVQEFRGQEAKDQGVRQQLQVHGRPTLNRQGRLLTVENRGDQLLLNIQKHAVLLRSLRKFLQQSAQKY